MAEAVRTARCACGALSAVARGEPGSVVMCSCTMCQRRSGSAFALSSYWDADKVILDGPSTAFERPTDAGRIFTHNFCPTCGTALWYFGSHRPGMIGISAGCFTDPDFPLPRAAVWDTTRHHWLDKIDDIPRLEKQRT